MLALQPTSIDWSAAQIEINDGVTTDQFLGSAVTMSIVEVMDELIAWATSTFIGTFSWTWTRDATTGGAIITLAVDAGTVTLEATNADAQAGYGLSAGVHGAAASHTFDVAAAGTWAPVSQMMVSGNLRTLDRGDACGDGAIRPGSPGIATNQPTAQAIGTALEAGRFAEQLADAASPRRAHLYQLHTDTWLELALGQVTRSPHGLMHYRFELDAVGDAL